MKNLNIKLQIKLKNHKNNLQKSSKKIFITILNFQKKIKFKKIQIIILINKIFLTLPFQIKFQIILINLKKSLSNQMQKLFKIYFKMIHKKFQLYQKIIRKKIK